MPKDLSNDARGQAAASRDHLEKEYKFLHSDGDLSGEDTERLFNDLVQCIRDIGYNTQPSMSALPAPVRQEDIYYDDDRLSLFHAGASFRIRSGKDTLRCTFKLPLPRQVAEEAEWFERSEEECPVGPEWLDMPCPKESDLKKLPPYQSLKRGLPSTGRLNRVLQVSNERRLLVIENGLQRAELCLDNVRFISSDGRRSGREIEIELESKGFAREELRVIVDLIKDTFPRLQPSLYSKYQRGMQWLQAGGKHEPV